MMKMPLTAIIFAIEALGCYENILYVVVASAVSFMITEIFGAKSINDTVVEDRVEELNDGKDARVIDTYVRVSENAFAVGKQIRDIFWPANLFVLSVKHDQSMEERLSVREIYFMFGIQPMMRLSQGQSFWRLSEIRILWKKLLSKFDMIVKKAWRRVYES